jgi:hypothetical protein
MMIYKMISRINKTMMKDNIIINSKIYTNNNNSTKIISKMTLEYLEEDIFIISIQKINTRKKL